MRLPPVLRLLAALLAAGAFLGCRSRTELVVFHASSLSRTFAEAAERFEKSHPQYLVRAEPSGSQVAARKVAELGLAADVVAVADARVIDTLLVPAHADFSLGFATNEIVLAHAGHSRFGNEATAEKWPEVLSRPGIRIGRVNPDLAPLGYQTLLAWALAEKALSRPGLAARLSAAVAAEHATSDEAELTGLLEARAIDYAFLYRSTAEDHRLPFTALPAEANLSRPELAAAYSAAAVEVQMKSGAAKESLAGKPILYALTIPRTAPHPEAAELFVAFLLGEEGKGVLGRAGLRPVSPPSCATPEKLPPPLRALVPAGAVR